MRSTRVQDVSVGVPSPVAVADQAVLELAGAVSACPLSSTLYDGCGVVASARWPGRSRACAVLILLYAVRGLLSGLGQIDCVPRGGGVCSHGRLIS